MIYKLKLTQLFFLLISLCLIVPACSDDDGPTDPGPDPIEIPEGTSRVEATAQRTGDPIAGRDYLVNGDYVDGGVPYGLYVLAPGATSDENLLGRTGDNENIPHDFTAVDAANGIRVVAANCLQCHAQKLNGELIVGLGNSVYDFTEDQSANIPFLDLGVQSLYGANSPEWEAYFPFRRAVLTTGPQLVTDVIGVNPADKLAYVLAAHRNPIDMTWIDEPQLDVPAGVIPTDVPAWWLLKKKNALYYTTVGKGDFARLIMASSLLTMQDTSKAREVDERFADVVAYIKSIEAPVYPETINTALLDRGQEVFETGCAQCHGTYGANETYPNLLVSLPTIGTDPMLASSNFAAEPFTNWYNSSWFNTNPFPSQLVATSGYIAPPLDGVWATAPYLHNGSVPTLEDLLNSSQRPRFWKRTYETDDFDYVKVGWNYTEETAGGANDIYDTTLTGYSNGGHTFGDGLNDADRAALIEYLKTL